MSALPLLTGRTVASVRRCATRSRLPRGATLVGALAIAGTLAACPSRVDETSSDTDGEACPNPAYTCAPACDDDECGPLEPFDARGCLRVPCTTDDACGSGEVCYYPALFGECEITNTIECEPEAAGCVCTVSGAPASYCVDADDLPTKLAGDCACGCQCGDPGSNSQVDVDGSTCFCDPGFSWCNPSDPSEYSCCPI